MASFSDDETFEIDSILEHHKRKGILQYLVQWKEGTPSWEPAARLETDSAAAVQIYLKRSKSNRRSSRSRSRKSSRSRSRSQSRNRKGASPVVKRSSSRSRGRPRKTVEEPNPSLKEEEKVVARKSIEKKQTNSEIEIISSEIKTAVLATASSSSSSSSFTSASVKASSSDDSMAKSTDKNESQHSERTLRSSTRSSTLEARQKLEVQRVHNEQRPVREDDNEPRSAIWKIADYAVIVLFVISLLAALFMFLEKFLDLENFKKQAFPSFETLSIRLHAGKDHLVEFFQYGWDRSSDGWDYILSQVKPIKAQPVQQK